MSASEANDKIASRRDKPLQTRVTSVEAPYTREPTLGNQALAFHRVYATFDELEQRVSTGDRHRFDLAR